MEMKDNFIYIPGCKDENIKASEVFRCKVPLSGTKQVFVVNGKVEKEMDELIIAKEDGGYKVLLKENQLMDEALQMIHVRTGESGQDMSINNEFILEKGSKARLLLCSHTLDTQDFVTDEHIQVQMCQGAHLELVIMQNENNNSNHKVAIKVNMKQDAVLTLHTITLHGGEIQNKIEVQLEERGAKAMLNGLYLADGNQKISTDVQVFHNVPECYSSQLFKGVLDGNSITKFSGKIYVAKDAQKTEAYQSNNNLLASKTAKAYTQPHLEIYADDVKCSHGATVGSLNDTELFYMRSRGITMQEAKLLQKQAFAYAVLEKISNQELRDRLDSLVEKRLRGEFSQCSDCSKHCC